jgi:hypothetical protein
MSHHMGEVVYVRCRVTVPEAPDPNGWPCVAVTPIDAAGNAYGDTHYYIPYHQVLSSGDMKAAINDAARRMVKA